MMHPYLDPYFTIHYEVWSTCRTKRIDAVLVSKQDETFKIGIEYKQNNRKQGADIGSWVLQAIAYTLLDWGRYGRLPIFVAPAISVNYFGFVDKIINTAPFVFEDRHDVNDLHHSFNGFIGKFMIGELRFIHHDKKQPAPMFMHTNKIIWDGRVFNWEANPQPINYINYKNLIQ